MGNTSILTVDLGNSNGSAALVLADGGGRFAVDGIGSWSRGSKELGAIVDASRVAGARAGTTRAAVSAVGSLEREGAASEALASVGFEVVVRPDAGLAMRIDHPETCGSDRQYAALGALALALGREPGGRPEVLVVDAGTALTVDAARAGNEDLEFLGGAIALGPWELQRAITGAGARLPEFDLDGDVPALGKSTREALRSGAVVGFRGAVRELCGSIAGEAFRGRAPALVLLTGGAEAFAMPVLSDLYGAPLWTPGPLPRPLPGDACLVHDPLLVHRGLGAAALGIELLGGGGP